MTDITKGVAEFMRVKDELRAVGVKLEIAPGEYRVSLERGHCQDAVFADDLEEAKAAGYALAGRADAPTRPVGPLGRSNTRRAEIYRHNAKLLKTGFWRKERP